MENTDDKRDNEIVPKPTNIEEAHQMLNQVESLMNEFRIVSPQMSGNFNEGFSYWTSGFATRRSRTSRRPGNSRAMNDETVKALEELRKIVNNFVIRGSGVAGNLKTGWVVKPGSAQIKSGPTTTP